jgi:cysteine desulfuration protein SufE
MKVTSTKLLFKSIKEIQDEIISEFKYLNGDREATINYIIEIGERLPSMLPLRKTEHNIVYGCVSNLWLSYEVRDGLIHFEGDSDASVTKGILALLIKIMSRQKLDSIINADLYFIAEIGLLHYIGQQRSFGLANVVKNMKSIAVAEKSKIRTRRRKTV